MPAARIALVSTGSARALDEDLEPLTAALAALGAETDVVDWDDGTVDWSRFDLAVLRSPWNYTQHVVAFRTWIERGAAATCLVNPAPLVRWNLDKHYLADLAAAGVPTVPGQFVEPGMDAGIALRTFLDRHADSAELVVKPAIGAGSRDARRHARDATDAARTHLGQLLDAGRSVLLQPYLDRVDEHGETALIFFGGEFSHAIRKGPLLAPGAESTRALFAAEHIVAREPSPAELAVARAALASIPFAPPFAYARVDLIRDADDAPHVLELELVEPSLFFAHAEGSAARFAAILAMHVARHSD
jgi:O-ureido-D-serine cyclo-ligase